MHAISLIKIKRINLQRAAFKEISKIGKNDAAGLSILLKFHLSTQNSSQ